MAAVGDITFDIMHGLPQKMRQRVDTWVVPGLDGVGAQTLGEGEGEFDLLTILYIQTGSTFDDRNDNANDIIQESVALQGTVVDVTDDWGDNYDNVLVVGVDAQGAKKRVIFNGISTIRVEIRWKMVRTGGNFLDEL